MFKRKIKAEAEQGRDRRQVSRTGNSPAFSYYNNRVPDATPRRSAARTETNETGKSRRMPRSLAQIPFWMLMIVAGLCLIKVLFLSTSPKIVILGTNAVSATYVRSAADYAQAAHKQLTASLTSHSKLTVNLNGTAQALEREFPELQAVSMTVPLVSSRPIVYVQVAQPSVVLQTAHGSYALNKSGLVLAKLRTVPSGVPLVVDQSGSSPVPGKQYLPSSTISFIQTVAYQLSAAKFGINTFVLPTSSLYELDVRVDSQPYSIKYDLQNDALVQSGAAIATLRQLGDKTPGIYLDVRVPERVYYK